MPGRHGKQVTKRGRSKRQRPTQMENTLKDSIRSRAVKERSILSKLVAPRVVKKFVNAVSVTPLMPMFTAAPVAAPAQPQPLPSVSAKQKTAKKKIQSIAKKTPRASQPPRMTKTRSAD